MFCNTYHLMLRPGAERVERLTKHLVEALYVSVDRRVARRIWTLAAMHGGAVRGRPIARVRRAVARTRGGGQGIEACSGEGQT